MKRLKVIIAFIVLSLSACTTPKKGPVETFEQLWQEVDANYGNFELRSIDWDDSYERYRPLVTDDMSDDEFFSVITDMLAETDDAHVHVIAENRPEWIANRIYRDKIDFDLFDIELVRQEYLGGDFETNDYEWYTLGELSDGTTYLHLKGIDDSAGIMSKARDRAKKSGRLVFDLRHNGGGSMEWALFEVADWTSKDLTISYNRTRNGPKRTDFEDWYTSKVEARGSDIDFEVVVLIDRYTVSAGERLVLALDQLEGVTFMGAPTNGSVATMVGKEMLNGWFYTVSTQEVMNPDRETSIEGVGFMPDIFVDNDLTEMEGGVDAVLDAAIAQF